MWELEYFGFQSVFFRMYFSWLLNLKVATKTISCSLPPYRRVASPSVYKEHLKNPLIFRTFLASVRLVGPGGSSFPAGLQEDVLFQTIFVPGRGLLEPSGAASGRGRQVPLLVRAGLAAWFRAIFLLCFQASFSLFYFWWGWAMGSSLASLRIHQYILWNGFQNLVC